MQGDFIWRGQRASDMGVVVQEPAPVKRPAMRVQTETVPGRSGCVMLGRWGEDVYEELQLPVKVAVRPGYSREAVAQWLSGCGQLVLLAQPEDAYEARLEDELVLTEMVPGHPDSYATGTVTFVCSPWRYEAMPAPARTLMVGSNRGANPRSGYARPLLHLWGHVGDAVALRCGEQLLTVTMTAQEAIVDCDWEQSEGCRTGGVFLSLPPHAPWEVVLEKRSGSMERVAMLPRYRSI